MSNLYKVVVFISGRGSNLKALHEAACENNLPYKIVGVISDQPSAGGLDYAQSNKIPTIVVPREPKKQNKAEFNEKLKTAAQSFKPDLIALAGYMRVLSPDLISAFPNAILNIHPSLLPDFKGLNIHERVLDSGVSFSGCTVHFVNETVDSGQILAQAKVDVLPGDTPESLASRILEKEHVIYSAVIASIASNSLKQVELSGDISLIIEDNDYFPKDSCFLKANAVGNSHYENKYL